MTGHQPIGYSDLPDHQDLIESALQGLIQVKNSLARHYRPTADRWHSDWPLVEACKSVNDAIALLCEHAAASRPVVPPPGVAAALSFPRVAAACPAPPPEDTFRGGAGPDIDVGTAWIGPAFTARR